MTPELKAAAERLRRMKAGESYRDVYRDIWDRALDYTLLTDWALSRLPAEDDGEPITEDWLREVGLARNAEDGDRENGLSIGDSSTRKYLYVLIGTEQWVWWANGHHETTPKCYGPGCERGKIGDMRLERIPSSLWPKTRGQFRRLAAFLGISLRN